MRKKVELTEEDLFVAYRLPGSKDYCLIQDEGIIDHSYEFIIHPFDKNGTSPVISLKSNFLQQNQPFHFQSSTPCELNNTDRTDYFNMAEDVIEKMERTTLEKVVLSRIQKVEAADINIFDLFQNLMSNYANAFVYFYNIPGQGTWMGATPEILMERKKDIITTVALAGTQKVAGRSIDEVTWNPKEIEEQAIIQRYIEDHLNAHNLPFEKGATKTSQAGNVFHIKTEYAIPNMRSTDELVDQLHPGPAICGMPKDAAMKQIISCESHDREYYCGYLGLKTKDYTSLFINLRCMQIFKDEFVLYIGGGLTKDSSPKSEWEETTTKSMTLNSVIQKSYIYAHDVE